MLQGATQVDNITVPTDFSGTLTLIPDSNTPFATGGNIAANFTATANVPVLAVYNGTLWYLK